MHLWKAEEKLSIIIEKEYREESEKLPEAEKKYRINLEKLSESEKKLEKLKDERNILLELLIKVRSFDQKSEDLKNQNRKHQKMNQKT